MGPAKKENKDNGRLKENLIFLLKIWSQK